MRLLLAVTMWTNWPVESQVRPFCCRKKASHRRLTQRPSRSSALREEQDAHASDGAVLVYRGTLNIRINVVSSAKHATAPRVSRSRTQAISDYATSCWGFEW